MSAPAPQPSSSPAHSGKKYRFVVQSAEEAVRLIRSRLGEEARVLSVRQIEGKGLSRFLSSPKLEIIAQNGGFETPAEEPAEDAPAPVSKAVAEEVPPVAEETPSAPFPEESVPAESAVSPAEPSASAREEGLTLEGLLQRAGFDRRFLARLEGHARWPELRGTAPRYALGGLRQLLREAFTGAEEAPLSARVAFIGAPGVGKTTALCKQLARDVFLHGRRVQVLKLDGEAPNSDDCLRTFCDILGVRLLRSPLELEDSGQADALYFDTAGLAPDDREGWSSLHGLLDDYGVDSRIFVLNAAYDSEILRRALSTLHRVSATHLIFTHLDEVPQCARLWPFLLGAERPTLFISHGQNITDDVTGDVVEYLLRKTFPPSLFQVG